MHGGQSTLLVCWFPNTSLGGRDSLTYQMDKFMYRCLVHRAPPSRKPSVCILLDHIYRFGPPPSAGYRLIACIPHDMHAGMCVWSTLFARLLDFTPGERGDADGSSACSMMNVLSLCVGMENRAWCCAEARTSWMLCPATMLSTTKPSPPVRLSSSPTMVSLLTSLAPLPASSSTERRRRYSKSVRNRPFPLDTRHRCPLPPPPRNK
jgi:hypothetical protein